MTETEADYVTSLPPTAAATFDAMGHCTICRLEELALKRVARMLTAGTAMVLRAYPGCGHPIIYRSVGNWTEIARLRGAAR